MKNPFCFKSEKRFICMAFVFLIAFLINPAYADTGTQTPDSRLKTQDLKSKIVKLNIPFILNQGQTDEDVKFYANTFGGTVFVTRDGSVVYSIPKDETRGNGQEAIGSNRSSLDLLKENCKSKGIAIKEEFLNANIKEINGGSHD